MITKLDNVWREFLEYLEGRAARPVSPDYQEDAQHRRRSRVTIPVAPARTISAPRLVRTPPPRSRSYAEDQGWTRRLLPTGYTEYRGAFRISPLIQWDGCIHVRNNRVAAVTIYGPPIAMIRKTNWGPCFHPATGQLRGWYWINFRPDMWPDSASCAISTVNDMLKDVYAINERQQAS